MKKMFVVLLCFSQASYVFAMEKKVKTKKQLEAVEIKTVDGIFCDALVKIHQGFKPADNDPLLVDQYAVLRDFYQSYNPETQTHMSREVWDKTKKLVESMEDRMKLGKTTWPEVTSSMVEESDTLVTLVPTNKLKKTLSKRLSATVLKRSSPKDTEPAKQPTPPDSSSRGSTKSDSATPAAISSPGSEVQAQEELKASRRRHEKGEKREGKDRKKSSSSKLEPKKDSERNEAVTSTRMHQLCQTLRNHKYKVVGATVACGAAAYVGYEWYSRKKGKEQAQEA